MRQDNTCDHVCGDILSGEGLADAPRERLITVRFEVLGSFSTFANQDLGAESDPLSSAAVFAGLMDATPIASPTYSNTLRPNSIRFPTACFAPRQPNPPHGAHRHAKALT